MIKYFPTVSKYNFGSTGGVKDVKNIFKSVNITIDDPESVQIEKVYPGERPEQLSLRLYGNFNYYWQLMLLNGIKNPFEWSTIIGQKGNYEELERYDTRVLQFYNSSPFLPSLAESGISYQGNSYYIFDEIDSYRHIDLTDIIPGDTIIFESGGGAYGIKSFGAGILPDSLQARAFGTDDIDNIKHYGQSITPLEFDNQFNVKQITAGERITCALTDTGYIYCWGEYSTLTDFNFNQISDNFFNSINGGYTFIEASNDKLVAINSSSLLEFFGSSSAGEREAYLAGQTTGVKTSWYHATDDGSTGGVVLRSNGVLVDYGFTGVPVGVTFTDVACGNQFCVGVMSTGGLTAWGANDYGQLSNIPSGTGFVEVSATYNHALARKTDGSVYAWGATADGQCVVPTGIYTGIAAGKRHSAAIDTNNRVIAWGKIEKAGFTSSSGDVTGITQSGYTLSNYSIYGEFDKIYSGDNHVVLRGLSGGGKKFVGIVTTVDDDYKRIVCKVYGGDLSQEELFLDDPTGTIVSIWRDGIEVKQIHHKLVGIQKQKNATVEIQSNDQTVPITSDIWKSVYILNYSNPDNDSRLITLQKLYDTYNITLKQDFVYASASVLQNIDSKVSIDLGLDSKTVLNYNISEV